MEVLEARVFGWGMMDVGIALFLVLVCIHVGEMAADTNGQDCKFTWLCLSCKLCAAIKSFGLVVSLLSLIVVT